MEGSKNGLALSTIGNINNINNINDHKSSSSLVDPATTLQQRQHRPVSVCQLISSDFHGMFSPPSHLSSLLRLQMPKKQDL